MSAGPQTKPAQTEAGQSKLMGVVRVASGNFLEQYDFFVFGYFATAIGRTFFPHGNSARGDFISLMLALMTFGAGFLMRPLGALVLGAYIDSRGRRAGLILTLALMAVGTVTIALVPGYAAIGLIAPLLVVIGRLVQGFSAGVELGGVSVYLAEIATPGNKGFFVSWQSGSQQVAVIFAATLGVLLTQTLSPATMQDWGWRIPLLIGCAIIPLLFILRRSLQETEAFLHRPHVLTAGQIFGSMLANWRIVGLGMMMVVMTTVSFYLITAYTPTFGRKELHLDDTSLLLVTVCVGVSNLFWLPVSGALSDRIGRRPLLIGCTVLAILTAYPVMSWLVAHPSFGHLLLVELWLSFIYANYNGAMVVYLTEVMPVDVRTAGFSLAYSLATVVGGMTPAICTGLIQVFGDSAVPGAWMAAAAVVGLAAVLLIGRAPAPAARALQA
jgi:MFS family permease